MTDTMTSQNIDLSSWDTLYINSLSLILFLRVDIVKEQDVLPCLGDLVSVCNLMLEAIPYHRIPAIRVSGYIRGYVWHAAHKPGFFKNPHVFK
jgi:hypothetical protein